MAKSYNRALKLAGETLKIGTPVVTVLEYNVSNDVMRAIGATLPTNGDRGYAVGCLFTKTGGTSGTILYVNEGSATSALFVTALNAVRSQKTVTTTASLTVADSGKEIFLNSATGFVTTLPAPVAGMRFTIISILANTSGNHTIVSASSANVIKGNQNSVAGDAGDTSTADDTISFVANQSVAGDKVELHTDGTSWFAYAISRVAAGITFTQAS